MMVSRRMITIVKVHVKRLNAWACKKERKLQVAMKLMMTPKEKLKKTTLMTTSKLQAKKTLNPQSQVKKMQMVINFL